MSETKYLRNGISSKIPMMPPNKELMKTSKKFTEISGYLSCKI